MAPTIRFEHDQSFQLNAIAAVTDLFQGSRRISSYEIISPESESLLGDESLFEEIIFANSVNISQEKLVNNLLIVQSRHKIKYIRY